MSERVAGQEFVADGSRWLCYLVRADGVACSEYVGPTINMQVLDYTKGCMHRERGKNDRFRECADYVVAGTERCRKHQIR